MKSAFKIRAVITTLASLALLTKAAPADTTPLDTPLEITLCSDADYGKCDINKEVYRYHCYQLDKATMGLSSIWFADRKGIQCRLFEGTTCDIAQGSNVWILAKNPNLNGVNFNDVANSFFCEGG